MHHDHNRVSAVSSAPSYLNILSILLPEAERSLTDNGNRCQLYLINTIRSTLTSVAKQALEIKWYDGNDIRLLVLHCKLIMCNPACWQHVENTNTDMSCVIGIRVTWHVSVGTFIGKSDMTCQYFHRNKSDMSELVLS